jgi:AcrR family transcriptional regulator
MTTPTTRDALLDAAADLFLAQGYDATSMEQVRVRAQASNGSLNHHYPTKAQLVLALYQQSLQDFHAHLLPVLANDPAAERGTRALVMAYIDWVTLHPQRARVLHELRRTDAVASAPHALGAANAEAFAVLRAWAERKAAAGEMRAMAFDVWIALVFAPLIHLTPLWTRQQPITVAPATRKQLAIGIWHAISA